MPEENQNMCVNAYVFQGPFPANCGVNKFNNKRSLEQRDLQSILRNLREADDVEIVKRITGGKEAIRGTYPWIAFLVIQHSDGAEGIVSINIIIGRKEASGGTYPRITFLIIRLSDGDGGIARVL